jgi:predicted Zn-dependent protease
VRRLATTVQYWERSLFGRIAGHHFCGLLLAASGKDAEAVDEYRAAVHSYTFGYTRVNYELARSLLRLGRPAEAVEVLQPALRGAIDAGNLYVTRTELHELLADAFSRLGQRDSTAAHARAVGQAWARADQRFLQRREAAQRLLARAERRQD